MPPMLWSVLLVLPLCSSKKKKKKRTLNLKQNSRLDFKQSNLVSAFWLSEAESLEQGSSERLESNWYWNPSVSPTESKSKQRTWPFSALTVPANVLLSSCWRTHSTTLLLYLGSQGICESRMGVFVCKKDRKLAALPENPFLQSCSEPWVRLKEQVLLPLTHS